MTKNTINTDLSGQPLPLTSTLVTFCQQILKKQKISTELYVFTIDSFEQ